MSPANGDYDTVGTRQQRRVLVGSRGRLVVRRGKNAHCLRLVHEGFAEERWRGVAEALLSLVRLFQVLMTRLLVILPIQQYLQHLPEVLCSSHQLLLQHLHHALIVLAALGRRVALHSHELLHNKEQKSEWTSSSSSSALIVLMS